MRKGPQCTKICFRIFSKHNSYSSGVWTGDTVKYKNLNRTYLVKTNHRYHYLRPTILRHIIITVEDLVLSVTSRQRHDQRTMSNLWQRENDEIFDTLQVLGKYTFSVNSDFDRHGDHKINRKSLNVPKMGLWPFLFVEYFFSPFYLCKQVDFISYKSGLIAEVSRKDEFFVKKRVIGKS